MPAHAVLSRLAVALWRYLANTYEACVTICVALVIARPILLTKLYYISVNLYILYLYFIMTQLKLPNDVVLLDIRIKEVSISDTFLRNAKVL